MVHFRTYCTLPLRLWTAERQIVIASRLQELKVNHTKFIRSLYVCVSVRAISRMGIIQLMTSQLWQIAPVCPAGRNIREPQGRRS